MAAAHAPALARPAAEATITALVAAGVAWHLRGQGDLPATYNEMYGLLTTCLPLSPADQAVVSVGHTLEAGLQWIAGHFADVCDFSGTSARWPALAATLATLGIGAWFGRGRRSLPERLLTTVFLVGTAHPLTYGHYGRPYAWLMLAGLVIWLLRDVARFSWLRAATGTAAALSLPMATPIWLAVLGAVARRKEASRAGLALEGALAVAATAWTAWLMTGPVAAYIDNLSYTWTGTAGSFNLETVSRLWSLPIGPAALRWLVGLAVPALVLRGMARRPPEAAVWLAASLAHVAAWAVLQPPAWPRYLLPEAMALPAFMAAGLPAAGHLRRLSLGLIAGYGVWALAAIHLAGPRIFHHVEMRGDPTGVGALLRDGDVLVTDGAFLTDMLLFPLAAMRDIEIVVTDLEPDVPWPTPPGALSAYLERFRQGRGRIGGVHRVPSWAGLDWPSLQAEGRRIVVAGVPSLHPAACPELCPEAFARPAHPLRVLRAESFERQRAELCRGRVRVVVVLEPGDDPSLAAFGLLDDEAIRMRRQLCSS